MGLAGPSLRIKRRGLIPRNNTEECSRRQIIITLERAARFNYLFAINALSTGGWVRRPFFRGARACALIIWDGGIVMLLQRVRARGAL
jgi:hypothetical protein